VTCPDDSAFAAYLDGALAGAEAAAFERHLDACAGCRAALAALARLAGPASQAGPPLVGPPRLRARGAACGRYLVLDVLGAGGMGVVYAAHDPELDRKVALKLVRPQAARGAADLRERLAREARVLARISHPNVVPVYDVGEADGDVFVAMEFVPGPTLARWQTEAPRTWRATLEMYLQAARGLGHAHAAGVVHRDFKPSNAIVGPDGRVRVVDFGLASASAGARDPDLPAPHAAAARTLTAALVGTPAYMAPEQWRGAAVDARSDQYSFCAALWEALAGAPCAAPDTTWRSGQVHPDMSRGTWPKGKPRWLRALLLRGLAADPAARLPGMQALIDACERRLARTRRGTAVAAAGVAVAALAWLRPGAAAPAPGCTDDPALLAGVWDRDAARALRRGFAASGQPYAGTTANGAVAALDAYAARWQGEQRAACEATRVLGTASEATLARRTICLADRRDALRERVALLRRGEPDVVEHALAIAHDLPDLAPCRDPAALAAYADDPLRRRWRADVDGAAALLRAGRFAAAEAAVAGAATARARGWDALAAEALRVLGEARQARGAGAAAEDAYYQSLWAAEAARDDRLAAQAWIRLTWLLADDLARPVEARRAADHARAAIARVGGDDPRLADDAAVSAAIAARAAGEFTAASEGLRAAVTSLAAHADADDPRLLAAIRLYGRSLHDRGEFAAAAAEYRRAIAVAERSLGAEHPALADLANNLGTTLIDLRDPDGAEPELRRALAIDLRVYGPVHLSTAAAFTNLANLAQLRGDNAEAERRYRAALQVYAALPRHPDAAKVAYNFGMVLIVSQRPAEALRQFEFALETQRRTLGADHPDAGAFLTGIGVSLAELGRFAEAVPPLEAAVALFEARPRDQRFVASARIELARALWGSGQDRTRARALAESAAAIFRERPESARLLADVEEWLTAHPASAARG
jgi:tetratricopeptide (TPR) repeat protein/predicted Ser/Thr protein kinase